MKSCRSRLRKQNSQKKSTAKEVKLEEILQQPVRSTWHTCNSQNFQSKERVTSSSNVELVDDYVQAILIM